MSTTLPSVQDIRCRLESLTRTKLQALSEASGVPFTTLWKIRVGETKNPGIETVRMFFRLLEERTDTVHEQPAEGDIKSGCAEAAHA